MTLVEISEAAAHEIATAMEYWAKGPENPPTRLRKASLCQTEQFLKSIFVHLASIRIDP